MKFALHAVVGVLVVAAAVATLVQTYRVGESGARAAWGTVASGQPALNVDLRNAFVQPAGIKHAGAVRPAGRTVRPPRGGRASPLAVCGNALASWKVAGNLEGRQPLATEHR